MRLTILAVLFLLVAADSAQAGPRGRFRSAPVVAQRFFATPPTPPTAFADRPVLATAARLSFVGLALAGDASLQWVGFGIPRAIRLVRLGIEGTPYPGRPGYTALWVAFPFTTAALDRLRGDDVTSAAPAGYYAPPVYYSPSVYYASPAPAPAMTVTPTVYAANSR